MKLGGQQLTDCLRDGDSRQVFSAIDLSDQRQTILKIAALACPADVDRLQREFAVLREAAGAGVVAALGHSIGLAQGMAWLVLAAHGPSLAAVLAAMPEQRLSTELALAAIHAAATSLGDLHARGWRHSDLKPGNLLANADGSVVLSDLEFAAPLGTHVDKSLRNSESRLGGTQGVSWAGTPPFVAPELWQRGASALSAATDVWALGVTLFLCVFGDYPFGREGDRAIAEAIDRGPPPQLMQLPNPLRELFNFLLARVPAERPADGREAAGRIATAAQQLGVDLAAAREAFGRLVAGGLGNPASAAEPGTVIGPAQSPQPLRHAAKSLRDSKPHLDEMRSREFFDIASRVEIASQAILLPPQPSAVASPPIEPPWPEPPPPKPPSLEPSTAIGLAPLPPVANAARSPVPALAPSRALPSPLTRRAAARWYRRMNPARNFPLSVVFSGKQIRIVGGSGLGITLGQREIALDPDDPVLSVEPHFPGCLISPPSADVHVSQEDAVCRFWVTPLVCGDLSEACVTIRYRGKVVESLATPAKVVTRTAAKVLAVLGLVTPLLGTALDVAGWNATELLRRSLPYAGDLLSSLGPLRSGACLAGILLAAALGYFYVTRPLLSDEPEPRLLPQPA
jgi:serine/threonine protein kinase